MTKRIDFHSTSGRTIHGDLAEPEGGAKAPAVIVIQEWWGVNDHVRSLVDRFAAAGFVALAPDLYHGKVTRDPAEAAKLLQELDWKEAVADVGGALAWLEKHARVGKVGVTGFCMGGAVALASAAALPKLAAVVPFYGIPDPATDYAKLAGAVSGHYAKKDQYVSPDRVEALRTTLTGLGKRAEFHMYDADHAFVNDTRPEVYDAAQAKVAWDRAVAFLHRELG